MKKINFCQNWNNKLSGNIYTTIRRHNNYYVQDEDYEIFKAIQSTITNNQKL